jgi:hypothetical protein
MLPEDHMQAIRAITGQELIWQQPHALERRYKLRGDDEVVARLTWEKRFGTLAAAETSTGRWTFKRVGFWRPRATVRTEGSDTDLAVFEPRWTGAGTLTTTAGREYRWSSNNIWQTAWQWSDTADIPLVRFASRQGLTRMSARVETLPAGEGLDDLALLVTLGWYLLILLIDDSSGVAAV